MKTLHIFKKPALITLCILGITSCEKIESDIEVIDQEGFMGTTGKSDAVEDDVLEVIKPVFHMHFGADVGKKEAYTKFNEAANTYLNKNTKNNKGAITNWYYEIMTWTDTGSYDGTDGAVRAAVRFNTNQGSMTQTQIVLNNTEKNDREPNSTDYYLIPVTFPYPIEWIEIKSASLRLKGTDGWKIMFFHVKNVFIPNSETNGTGSTYIFSTPTSQESWLDNNCSNCWDTFYTGNIGQYRLNF